MKKLSYILLAVAACFVVTDMASAQRSRSRDTDTEGSARTSTRSSRGDDATSVGRSGRSGRSSGEVSSRGGRGTRGGDSDSTDEDTNGRGTASSGRSGGRSGRSGSGETASRSSGSRGTRGGSDSSGSTSERGGRGTASSGRSGRSGRSASGVARGNSASTGSRSSTGGRNSTASAGQSTGSTGRSGGNSSAMMMNTAATAVNDTSRSGRTRMAVGRSGVTVAAATTATTAATTTTTTTSTTPTMLTAMPTQAVQGMTIGNQGMVVDANGQYVAPSAVNYYDTENQAYGQVSTLYSQEEAQRRAEAERDIADVQTCTERYKTCMDEICLDTVKEAAGRTVCSSSWKSYKPKEKQIDELFRQLVQLQAQAKILAEFGEKEGVEASLQAATTEAIVTLVGDLGMDTEKLAIDMEGDEESNFDFGFNLDDDNFSLDSLVDYGNVGGRKEGDALRKDAEKACEYVLKTCPKDEISSAKSFYSAKISKDARAYDVSLDETLKKSTLAMQKLYNEYQRVAKKQEANKNKYSKAQCLEKAMEELQDKERCDKDFAACYTDEAFEQQKAFVSGILGQCQAVAADVWTNLKEIALGRGQFTESECSKAIQSCIQESCGEGYKMCPSLDDVILYRTQCSTNIKQCGSAGEEIWEQILVVAENEIRLNCKEVDEGYWDAEKRRCITQTEREMDSLKAAYELCDEAAGEMFNEETRLCETAEIQNQRKCEEQGMSWYFTENMCLTQDQIKEKIATIQIRGDELDADLANHIKQADIAEEDKRKIEAEAVAREREAASKLEATKSQIEKDTRMLEYQLVEAGKQAEIAMTNLQSQLNMTQAQVEATAKKLQTELEAYLQRQETKKDASRKEALDQLQYQLDAAKLKGSISEQENARKIALAEAEKQIAEIERKEEAERQAMLAEKSAAEIKLLEAQEEQLAIQAGIDQKKREAEIAQQEHDIAMAKSKQEAEAALALKQIEAQKAQAEAMSDATQKQIELTKLKQQQEEEQRKLEAARNKPVRVYYGVDVKHGSHYDKYYASKVFNEGDKISCSNSTFGDPKKYYRKRCKIGSITGSIFGYEGYTVTIPKTK